MLVMQDAAKFMKYFPEPLKRSKLDWDIIDRYMRMWHNDIVTAVRRRIEIERRYHEEEECRHLEECFMFDYNERFF